MSYDTFETTCIRHSDTPSNLRCGRCNDLICPQCMVQSPVGARCPDCASIGRPAIFRSTPAELARAIGLSFLGSIVIGVAYGIILWVIFNVPVGWNVGNVAAAFVLAVAGSPVGDLVLRAGKYKLDSRLRVIAAFSMFLVWVWGFAVASFVGVPISGFMNIVGYIGLGIGVYVAMNKVRP
ncbi:MAG: B-box zinc finger protein [Dehalococcoidia bacterium]